MPVSALPSIVSGALAMLALARVPFASLDAFALLVAMAGAVAAARVRGPLAGTLGGAAAALVSFVGARHGDVVTATAAGAALAILPLAGRAFPRGSWRLLLLAAASVVASSASVRLAPWAAAALLHAIACSRARAEGRVDLRAGAALALSLALVAPSCLGSTPALVLLAVVAAHHASIAVASACGRGSDAGMLLEAGWPLLDAIALAACGHPLIAIECVAFVPFARRMALVELFA